MGLLSKKENKVTKTADSSNLPDEMEKLSVFVTIVPKGQSVYLLKLYKYVGCNIQFIQRGEGTAQAEIRDILGLDDNGKDVILSIVPSSRADELANELDAFFSFSKKNRGIGFSIPMTSIIGLKMYQFLTDGIRG